MTPSLSPDGRTGVGNTLVSDELSGDTLDFMHQFVGRPFTREVTVHNMGRRAVTLTLTNEKVEEVRKAFSKTGGERTGWPQS